MTDPEANDPYVQHLITENIRLQEEKNKTNRRYRSLKEKYLDNKHAAKTIEKEKNNLLAENWGYEAVVKHFDKTMEEMERENESLKYEAVDNLIDQEYVVSLESQKAALERKNAALQHQKERWRELARMHAPADVFANRDLEDVAVDMHSLELSGEAKENK